MSNVIQQPYNFLRSENRLVITCLAPGASCALVPYFSSLENVSTQFAQTADNVAVCSLRLCSNTDCMPVVENLALRMCQNCQSERVK